MFVFRKPKYYHAAEIAQAPFLLSYLPGSPAYAMTRRFDKTFCLSSSDFIFIIDRAAFPSDAMMV